MLFQPLHEKQLDGVFSFSKTITAVANSAISHPLFQELWHGFCCRVGEIDLQPTEKLVFSTNPQWTPPPVSNGFFLRVTPQEINIAASNKQNLIYGFYTLIERIIPVCTDDGCERFEIPCTEITDDARIKTRMVHICIFPETSYAFMQKFIRIAAFLRYTHIIIEFWGALQFDCLKELSWNTSFTKAEIRKLIQEARTLGLEPVPMFNHWGHATSSRVSYGKHVILDQNPKLATLFDVSGWNWNLTNEKVRSLHKQIRRELIELFDNPTFFHIGCDEAYGSLTEKDFITTIEYINEVNDELQSKNVKTIMWGDMLLYDSASLRKTTKNVLYNCCPSKEIQTLLLQKLSRSVLIADWQYEAKEYPIETALFMQENGFKTLCCPWDMSINCIKASVKTVKEHHLYGIIHTTWHTLSTGMPMVAFSAKASWEKGENSELWSFRTAYLASIIRKLYFADGIYENAGWTKEQIQERLP